MNEAKRQSFANAVAQIRSLEKRMLHRGELESALALKALNRVEAALQASGYHGIAPGVLKKSNFDELLRDAMEHFAQEVLLLAPDEPVLDLLFLEYDIYNIKALLMSGDPEINFVSDIMRIPPSRAARYRILSDQADTPTQSFYETLFTQAQTLYRESGAKATQDMLDRAYFARLLELTKELDIALCTAYAQAKVDFYNILSLLRIRGMAKVYAPITDESIAKLHEAILVDGGLIPLHEIKKIHGMPTVQMMQFFDDTIYRKHLIEGINASYNYDGNLSYLEKVMDDYVTGLMRDKQFVALGPEPLLGYLHGRKIEMINIRLILTSIFYHVPKQAVLERLREGYA